MSPIRWVTLAVLLLPPLLLAGCGIEPTGVRDGGEAPTGVAPGPALYYIDADDELRPDIADTDRLGTVAEAVTLLLARGSTDPGGGLRTEIPDTPVTRTIVHLEPGVIVVRLPLASSDLTSLGADQVVCTALAVHVQSGGSPATSVRLSYTIAAPGTPETPRRCPALG